MQGEENAQLSSFFISVLDGGEESASRNGCFTPGKEPQYAMNRKLGAEEEKEKSFTPARIQTPARPATSHYTDYAFPPPFRT
jgi:hypothetical protein